MSKDNLGFYDAEEPNARKEAALNVYLESMKGDICDTLTKVEMVLMNTNLTDWHKVYADFLNDLGLKEVSE